MQMLRQENGGQSDDEEDMFEDNGKSDSCPPSPAGSEATEGGLEDTPTKPQPPKVKTPTPEKPSSSGPPEGVKPEGSAQDLSRKRLSYSAEDLAKPAKIPRQSVSPPPAPHALPPGFPSFIPPMMMLPYLQNMQNLQNLQNFRFPFPAFNPAAFLNPAFAQQNAMLHLREKLLSSVHENGIVPKTSPDSKWFDSIIDFMFLRPVFEKIYLSADSIRFDYWFFPVFTAFFWEDT